MAETVTTELGGNGVQGADDDLPFQTALATVEDDRRPVAQVFVEGFLGLFGQFNAVDQKEHAGNDGRLQPSLHQHGYGQGLARTGGHLKEHASPTGDERVIRFLQTLKLVGTCLDLLTLEIETVRQGLQ